MDLREKLHFRYSGGRLCCLLSVVVPCHAPLFVAVFCCPLLCFVVPSCLHLRGGGFLTRKPGLGPVQSKGVWKVASACLLACLSACQLSVVPCCAPLFVVACCCPLLFRCWWLLHPRGGGRVSAYAEQGGLRWLLPAGNSLCLFRLLLSFCFGSLIVIGFRFWVLGYVRFLYIETGVSESKIGTQQLVSRI